ncbi:VOC family protein [Dinghuibacter silviterrae]|uniref:Glyoxalase/bleomycin resistance protein/dioxygenase superfamily protein n=1 Tax=Dinghuibacter silviterrae TaxID=1539049 RepID=A0A4V6Q9Y6_9BACT|nr:VOC family protein [Dinghuibacter silviterrae]TDW99752.1 glyoxalase/bleomycin resistance protein/dioxygenase superfamily protein [Dinghuibacter silviterrae]
MNTFDILPLTPGYGPEQFAAEARTHATPDAETLVARSYGFGSADTFRIFLDGMTQTGAPIAAFEAAADAVVKGELGLLQELLHAHPQLVFTRSMRWHGATLLHYTGANLVEQYRQVSPPNAIRVAEVLLKAGAEVDAVMGPCTTLTLVATSIHPHKAGVQIGLLETLLASGASVEGAPGASPLQAALDNDRLPAALWLATHGAKLSLMTAAGIGSLEDVAAFLEGNSDFLALRMALVYAGRYGHTSVVRYLVERGVPVDARGDDGFTALHWAAHGGFTDTVRYLLSVDAPLELENCYGGTVLGQTLWSAGHGPLASHPEIASLLVDAGARVRPGTLRWWLSTGASDLVRDGIEAVLRKQVFGSGMGIQSPVCLCLQVADLPRSLTFYRDVLGFSASDNDVSYGPVRLLLSHGPVEPAVVFIQVADIAGAWDTLYARGAQPTEPARVNWIKYQVVEVRDPDGYRLWFAESYNYPVTPLSGQLNKSNPHLPCTDVASSLAYYRDILGFHVNYAQEDLAVMDRDKVTVILVSRSRIYTGVGGCYCFVRDVDALYDELTAKGARVLGPPVSYPWGLRNFTVVDPEGNQLHFGQSFE